MIDINLIREKPEWVKERSRVWATKAPLDDIPYADQRRREIIQEVEELRRQQRKLEAKSADGWGQSKAGSRY